MKGELTSKLIIGEIKIRVPKGKNETIKRKRDTGKKERGRKMTEITKGIKVMHLRREVSNCNS
jgi:hypothetical protein